MNDYLNLSNGVSVRIEANWNAIAGYAADAGITNLAELDAMARMKPEQYPVLIWHCAREGERMDGRAFEMTLKEFTGLLRFPQVGEFNQIYARQTSPTDTLKKKS